MVSEETDYKNVLVVFLLSSNLFEVCPFFPNFFLSFGWTSPILHFMLFHAIWIPLRFRSHWKPIFFVEI